MKIYCPALLALSNVIPSGVYSGASCPATVRLPVVKVRQYDLPAIVRNVLEVSSPAYVAGGSIPPLPPHQFNIRVKPRRSC